MDKIRKGLNILIISLDIFIVAASQFLPLAYYTVYREDNVLEYGYLYIFPPAYAVQSPYYIVHKWVTPPIDYQLEVYYILFIMMTVVILHMLSEYKDIDRFPSAIITVLAYSVIIYKVSDLVSESPVYDTLKIYRDIFPYRGIYINFIYGPIYYILISSLILKLIYLIFLIIPRIRSIHRFTAM